jgi:hypothetical protein
MGKQIKTIALQELLPTMTRSLSSLELITLCVMTIWASASAFSSQHPAFTRSANHVNAPTRSIPSWTLYMSSDYGQEEQAAESIQSLVEFHEGTWKGKSTSFTVTADVAAGIVQRKTSPEYSVSVKLGLNSQRDYSLTESLAWDDTFSSRSLSLSHCNVDIDSVDASYSLDSTLPNLPSAFTGTDKLCQFAIEHVIAASDDRRMRCMLLYGVDQSLIRVVVCDESRVKQDQAPGSESLQTGITSSDMLEIINDVDRLVDKITGGMSQTESTSITDSSSSSSETSISREDPLERLQKSMSSSSDDGALKLSPHTITLVELISGTWLGDTIIRDMPMVANAPDRRGEGFGSSPAKPSSSDLKKAFASWDVGVQKSAWRWMWNFGEEIRQVVDVGKYLGTRTADCLSQSLSGDVCVNESLARRVPKDERMVYIDWADADKVGFILGYVSILAPRFLNFDQQNGNQKKPFFTEFCLYQATDAGEITKDNVEEAALPEVCCSKMYRVYNFQGKLKQGCTSISTLQRFGEETE